MTTNSGSSVEYSDMKIPDKAVKYILFQRTACLFLPRTLFFRALKRFTRWPSTNIIVRLESVFRKSRAKELFTDDMRSDYDSISQWLDVSCDKVLDIGCGVAGIDVFLYRHYNCAKNIDFYLLDKTSVDEKVYYYFEKHGSFYNSLSVAEDILHGNGISRERIHPIEVPSDFRIDVPQGLDLVISLASWGYHYPVETYLEQVYSLLRQGGRLIMDIRKGTDGEKEVEEKFGKIQMMPDADKIRILAIK